MLTLPNALKAWPSDAFIPTLKTEIEALKPSALPIAKGMYVDDSHLEVTVLSVRDDTQAVQANIGVFYSEILIGCNCGDDPPRERRYCEMRVRIDKASAETELTVVED